MSVEKLGFKVLPGHPRPDTGGAFAPAQFSRPGPGGALPRRGQPLPGPGPSQGLPRTPEFLVEMKGKNQLKFRFFYDFRKFSTKRKKFVFCL